MTVVSAVKELKYTGYYPLVVKLRGLQTNMSEVRYVVRWNLSKRWLGILTRECQMLLIKLLVTSKMLKR